MINVEEHWYDDDPRRGHADVRTRLAGAFYFFLGNGLILAAVQDAPEGEGSPYGLLLSDPRRLGSKRQSLSLDPGSGLGKTMLSIGINGAPGDSPSQVRSAWDSAADVPTVLVNWETCGLAIAERFFCPDQISARLVRRVLVRNAGSGSVEVDIRTGVREREEILGFSLAAGGEKLFLLAYELIDDGRAVELSVLEEEPDTNEARMYWGAGTELRSGSEQLDRFFRSSCAQLPAVISKGGVVDASIWQYGREWVRDHSNMVLGLVYGGRHELAREVLQRLLRDFVSEDGDTIDSSERRAVAEVELDQNGILLYALQVYFLWTGDLSLVQQNWEIVERTAEYPLRDVFRHDPSGLLHNCREYWERHGAFGLEPGIELIYQVYVILGLEAAAMLADLTGRRSVAERWRSEAQRLREATLGHPKYRLRDQRGLLKRLGLDGQPQESITPREGSQLPQGVPLTLDCEHLLNPDTCTAIPIALGFVDPAGETARATLAGLEELWDQQWDGGGYGRYNTSSEPDSPGSWPFASLPVVRAHVEAGEGDKVWRTMRWLDSIPGARSGAWFENYGPRISPPFPQVGVPPWTWAEMIELFVYHIAGLRPQRDCLVFRPRPLPGLERIEGSAPLRGHRVIFDIEVDRSCEKPRFETSAGSARTVDDELHIDYEEGDITISAAVAPIGDPGSQS